MSTMSDIIESNEADTAAAQAADAQAAEAKAAEKSEDDEPVNYTAFRVLAEAMDIATASDGDSDAVKNARQVFTDLNAKSKRAAKKWLRDTSEELMEKDDFANAKLYVVLRNNVAKIIGSPKGSTTSRKSPAAKATEIFRTLHLAYQVAAHRAQQEGVKIEEVVPNADTDLAPIVQYVAWIEAGQEDAEPEIDTELKRAARVAIGRGPGGQGRKPGTKNESDNDDSGTSDSE